MLQDNQKLVAGPLPFVKIPPGHYTVVINPIDKRCLTDNAGLGGWGEGKLLSYFQTPHVLRAPYCVCVWGGGLGRKFMTSFAYLFLSLLYSKCKVEGKLYDLSFGYREIRLHGVRLH